MNDILQKAIEALGILPGFGLGQTIKSEYLLPTLNRTQMDSDTQQQKNITDTIHQIVQDKNAGLIPGQEYNDIQSQYQNMANKQMQTAKDIETVRNNGLTSLGLSGGLLALPELGPKIVSLINPTTLRQIDRPGGLPQWKLQSLFQNIASKLIK